MPPTVSILKPIMLSWHIYFFHLSHMMVNWLDIVERIDHYFEYFLAQFLFLNLHLRCGGKPIKQMSELFLAKESNTESF